MKESVLLILDAVINLSLGLLLIFFPPRLVAFLGVPTSQSAFYPNLLGAVLFGIGLALFLETRKPGFGLGLRGAVTINVCGGAVLLFWLVLGNLSLSPPGAIFLWILVALLFGLSLVELIAVLPRGTSQA